MIDWESGLNFTAYIHVRVHDTLKRSKGLKSYPFQICSCSCNIPAFAKLLEIISALIHSYSFNFLTVDLFAIKSRAPLSAFFTGISPGTWVQSGSFNRALGCVLDVMQTAGLKMRMTSQRGINLHRSIGNENTERESRWKWFMPDICHGRDEKVERSGRLVPEYFMGYRPVFLSSAPGAIHVSCPRFNSISSCWFKPLCVICMTASEQTMLFMFPLLSHHQSFRLPHQVRRVGSG